MKDMTLTQEYFICAVNGKGKISGFSTEKQVCLVAAGLLELQMEGCICIDKNRWPSQPRCPLKTVPDAAVRFFG